MTTATEPAYGEWWLDGGGWDGMTEATHVPCRTRIDIEFGEPLNELLARLDKHECPAIPTPEVAVDAHA